MSVVPGKSVSIEDVAGPSQSRNNEKSTLPLQSEGDETSSSETESDSSSEEDFQEEAHNKSVDCALDVKIDGWSLRGI